MTASMTTVLIAVDGTEESHRAARRAKELFGPDARYLVVSVAQAVPPVMTAAPVETVLPPDPHLVEAMTEQAEADAHEAAVEDMPTVDRAPQRRRDRGRLPRALVVQQAA
jgi:nucleotide-binding universal stress UspA family protein